MKKVGFKDLLKLAEILRSEKGCPWDREQTIASMLEFIESEVHEVRIAIENGDHENLREELGDVMFQLIMVAQIAKENKYFDMDDVIKDIDIKIRERHTQRGVDILVEVDELIEASFVKRHRFFKALSGG